MCCLAGGPIGRLQNSGARLMKSDEPTLHTRAGRMYRQLLILQRLFQDPHEPEDVEWIGTGDRDRDVALCAAVKELIDELTMHAKILTSIPFPIREWRPGDGPDDERWRALTDVERRDVLSMVSSYEGLISWAERIASNHLDRADLAFTVESGRTAVANQPTGQLSVALQRPPETMDYLKAERTRVVRFRQEMAFLDRRRSAG